ncbi:MAG: rhodanese-like domain-containing protein [Ignavibacteriaceae bacterium]
MYSKILNKKSILPFITFIIFGLLLSACSKGQEKNSGTEKVKVTKSDPWTENDLIMPETLQNELKSNNEKPMLIQIGFKMLYDQDHIPGSIYAGPAFKSDGIQKLKDTLQDVDRNKNIVLYCGCCKWVDCPNVRPGFKAVKEMGFKNAKLLYLKNTLMINWVNKGYPSTH